MFYPAVSLCQRLRADSAIGKLNGSHARHPDLRRALPVSVLHSQANFDGTTVAVARSPCPTRGGQPLIFMVGCGHLEDGRFAFRCFTAAALTEAAEAEVIERWLGHMEEVKRRLGFVGLPRVFHWSQAESRPTPRRSTRPRPGTPTGRGRTRGSSTS